MKLKHLLIFGALFAVSCAAPAGDEIDRKVEELLAKIRQSVKCEVTPRSTHLNSSAIDAEHPAVKRLVDMGRVPFGSPTLSNQAVMPFPTLKLGPGDSARSHTADEYIMLDEIREAIDIYEKVLDNLIIEKITRRDETVG